jgi:hypothetical protein
MILQLKGILPARLNPALKGGLLMKKILGSVLSLALGLLFGFFGVMNSVFSDGAMDERLVIIAVILVIYGLLGLLLGFFFSEMHITVAILLVIPGIVFLTLFLFSELYLLILLYMVLLIFMTFVSVKLGHHLYGRTRKNY